MDVGHFVPQYIKDYYDSPNNDYKESDSFKETREPYRAVSGGSNNSRLSTREKRMTQQLQPSRNLHDQFFNISDESKQWF